MDKVTAVRKRLNREQWKSLISECRSSGMTVSRWCKENNICEQTYYKNLKKLREEMIESLPSPLSVANEHPATFQKLEFQLAIPESKASVLIHLPNATLEVQNGATQSTVEAVLSALKSIC